MSDAEQDAILRALIAPGTPPHALPAPWGLKKPAEPPKAA